MRVMRDLVGEVLSHRYRLVARIAGGGMGEVYRAHDMLLDRTVAVKVLQPSLAADPELVNRFRAEARAAARLSHPNIVAVHDWGSEDEQTYYMVMEYVSGSDLRDLLVSRGSLDPSHAASIMASACEALAVAHNRGLVHRDVKPENILLARDGTVKVADFGIAAMVDADLTSPGGTIPGTMRYLSPEQARGEDADKTSDIWAAGAVLCELLIGAPPSSGTGPEMLRRRAHEPIVAPSELDPSVPRELDDIVLKACALERADRYHDANEMARDLRAFVGTSTVEVPPVDHLLDHVTGEIRLPDMEPTTFVSNRARRRQLKKRSRIRTAMMAALVAILLLVAGRAAAWLFLPQMVPVPGLTGISKTAAAQEADAAGFEIEIVDRERTPDVPKGHVIEQNPAIGELKEGSTIELVISAGPPLSAVPDLVGMEVGKAEDRLLDRELELGQIRKEYSAKPEGTVLSQDPADGKAEWGSAVTLVVSKGPEPTEVPEVIGMRAARAKTLLEEAGLVPKLIDAYSDDVAEGRVISTDPIPTAVIGEGSDVSVYVSIGPQFKKVKMPDVRNMNVDSARAKLERLGLRVEVVAEGQCEGGSTVVETHPVAGEMIRENDRVALFVC